tara:strand:+ start:382 stop:768 length:387 start_codon:yes stop_codon:yes gene_type:complete
MTVKELRQLSKSIVDKSKASARVDTGLLKRSISYVLDNDGVPTFTEFFYGQFGNNSDLEENIKEMMPFDQAWKLIYVDETGSPFQVVRQSASGRASVETQATKATTRKSLGIFGIKNFLNKLKGGKKD